MTNPMGAGAPVAWHVTQQIEQVGQAPGGQLVKGMLVRYALDSGPSASVFVPLSEYTPEAVQAAVAAQAATLKAVHGLSGSV